MNVKDFALAMGITVVEIDEDGTATVNTPGEVKE